MINQWVKSFSLMRCDACMQNAALAICTTHVSMPLMMLACSLVACFILHRLDTRLLWCCSGCQATVVTTKNKYNEPVYCSTRSHDTFVLRGVQFFKFYYIPILSVCLIFWSTHMRAHCSLVMFLCEQSLNTECCTSSAICWTVIADNVDIQVVCMHVNRMNSHGNHVDDNEENKTLWKSISTTNLCLHLVEIYFLLIIRANIWNIL